MKTLEQRRAAYAWNKLEELLGKPVVHSNRSAGGKGGTEASRVVVYLQRLPAMVLTNGLGQTLAFLLSRSEGVTQDPAYVVFDVIAEWLVDHRRFYDGERRRLLAALMEGDRGTYRLAQYETWELLSWLKSFAQAYDPSANSERVATGDLDAT